MNNICLSIIYSLQLKCFEVIRVIELTHVVSANESLISININITLKVGISDVVIIVIKITRINEIERLSKDIVIFGTM